MVGVLTLARCYGSDEPMSTQIASVATGRPRIAGRTASARPGAYTGSCEEPLTFCQPTERGFEGGRSCSIAALPSIGSSAPLRAPHQPGLPVSRQGPPRFGLVPRPSRTPATHYSRTDWCRRNPRAGRDHRARDHAFDPPIRLSGNARLRRKPRALHVAPRRPLGTPYPDLLPGSGALRGVRQRGASTL